VAQFLRALTAAAGLAPAGLRVVAGRPVRFAGEFADDAVGEIWLRESFAAAGFHDVAVALEPEAAGWRFARSLTRPATVLVGDFGGGTSFVLAVRRLFEARFGAERVTAGGEFVSVAEGLALIGAAAP
jgi:hypothetical chaperone protein